MKTCDYCGNPVSDKVSICPYCKQPIAIKKETAKPQEKKIKTINLEYGKPFVDEALTRFNYELQIAKKQDIGLLKIIHGYGSTGKGGKIKIALQKHLRILLAKQQITKIIMGENYSKSSQSAKSHLKLIKIYHELAETIQADKYNPGITFVEL